MEKENMDIATYRREYLLSGLNREMLLADPLEQFTTWFKQVDAVPHHMDINAMMLATVSDTGKPSLRTVLLKSVDAEGFIFFTNYTSSKARDIADNPQVNLLFPWLEVERQVEVSGTIERLSDEENYTYIRSRPRGSQLGAWASKQSSEVANRDILEQRLAALDKQFAEEDVPMPDFWGGYRVIPHVVEFWQGRANRLHDRFEYFKENQQWSIRRLSP